MKSIKSRSPRHTTPGRCVLSTRWARYEILKAEFAAKATTSAEYAAACRRAAQMARV